MGSSSRSRLPPRLEQGGEVQPVALAARQVLHLLLLVGALEAEARGVGSRVHLALAHHHDVLAAVRDLLPDVALALQALAALVDVGELDRVADAQRARVGLLLADDHAEQGGLAGAVRPDDAHDAAAGQDEVQVVHEQVVAVALAEVLRFDDQVAQAGPGRDGDLARSLALLLGLLLGEQLLVVGEAGLALGLAGARGHAHPLELALQRALARRLFLLLLRQAVLLLVEPGGVVALPGDPRAAVELQDPARHVVEEVAVVGHGHHGARVLLEEALQPGHRLRVQVVRGLVEEQQVRGCSRSRHSATRRRSPPESFVTSASPGGRRSASIAISSSRSSSQAFAASIWS